MNTEVDRKLYVFTPRSCFREF